jgi:hypothetical protein
VSARLYLMIGLTVAALVVGWRMVSFSSESAGGQMAGSVTTMLDTVTRAQFTAAAATLDAQRSMTGSYAGAQVQPPLQLVQASTTSYCIELTRDTTVVHLAGPGGATEPGSCSSQY